MMSDREEIWRDVPGYDGVFQVSNCGQVRRTRGRLGAHTMGQWTKKGYPVVRLTCAALGKRELEYVHRLVAKAFIPNPEGKSSVNHIDCNPKNNFVENLEWCTQPENVNHSRRLGRYPVNYWKGKRGFTASLNDAQVAQVKSLRAANMSYKKIADEVGTNKTTVMRIINGKTYL